MNALNCNDALTCWNSEGKRHDSSTNHKAVKHHSFVINFGRPVIPIELCIQFQAGFVAEKMVVLWKTNGSGDEEEWTEVDDFDVDDDHDMQSFSLQQQNQQQQQQVTSMKLIMSECTDFFDRVTVYMLQVWGKESE
jgi:hypothetical protein